MRQRGLLWPLVVIGVAMAARRWLDVVEVRGRSMAPTLLPGDRLLVARLPIGVGDVVLTADPRSPSREFIKRVTEIRPTGVVLRGDNPTGSTDARAFGSLSLDAVTWRAVLRYAPLARAGRLPPAPPLDEIGGEAACTVPEALIAGRIDRSPELTGRR